MPNKGPPCKRSSQRCGTLSAPRLLTSEVLMMEKHVFSPHQTEGGEYALPLQQTCPSSRPLYEQTGSLGLSCADYMLLLMLEPLGSCLFLVLRETKYPCSMCMVSGKQEGLATQFAAEGCACKHLPVPGAPCSKVTLQRLHRCQHQRNMTVLQCTDIPAQVALHLQSPAAIS